MGVGVGVPLSTINATLRSVRDKDGLVHAFTKTLIHEVLVNPSCSFQGLVDRTLHQKMRATSNMKDLHVVGSTSDNTVGTHAQFALSSSIGARLPISNKGGHGLPAHKWMDEKRRVLPVAESGFDFDNENIIAFIYLNGTEIDRLQRFPYPNRSVSNIYLHPRVLKRRLAEANAPRQ